MMKYNIGDHVYIIESKRYIRAGIIIGVSNGFYTIKFDDGGGIRVRESRIYATKEDVEDTTIPKNKSSYRLHYDA